MSRFVKVYTSPELINKILMYSMCNGMANVF